MNVQRPIVALGPPIIDKSRDRPIWVQIADIFFTIVMWLLYFYMIKEAFRDLLDLGRDAYGWAINSAPWRTLPAITRFLKTMEDYVIVAASNSTVLVGWALYNLLRYGGPDQRQNRQTTGVADLAALYQFPARDITLWRNSRVLVMHHGRDGRLLSVAAKNIENGEVMTNARRLAAISAKDAAPGR